MIIVILLLWLLLNASFFIILLCFSWGETGWATWILLLALCLESSTTGLLNTLKSHRGGRR